MVVRIRWFWIVIPLLIIVLCIGGFYYYTEEVRIIPEELVRESLEKTLNNTSYRYETLITLKLDGKEERLLSNIKGERSADNFHFKGEMVGQKVEVFQVKDNTYSLDLKSGKWMITPGNELFQPELFMTEINPLSNFSFSEVNDIVYLGKEKIGKRKYYVITCKPVVKNTFMEKYWQDFSYRLWIDKRSRRIVKAQVNAKNIKDPKDLINISLVLYDFNKNIAIEPPKED